MATVNLISALKLMRQFGDSEATVSVIQATIDELERLYEVETHAHNLAYAIKTDRQITDYSNGAADSILKMVKNG